MFIRSQDKTRLLDLECAGLSISPHYKPINEPDSKVQADIVEYICGHPLGTYESEERYLEIMDDICTAIVKDGKAVYYMPDE